MLRFLLPAVVLVGALIVLLAGALGDFQSLPNLPSSIPSLVASITPDHTTQPATSVPSAEPTPAHPAGPAPQADSVPPITPTAPVVQPALDVLQHQAADLKAQIAQRTSELASLQGNADQARHELASLQGNTDQARHELDTLHQQQADEETALERLKARERQASNPPASPPGPPPPAPSQSQPPPTAAPPARSEVQTALSRLRAEQKQTAPATPENASARAARTQQTRPSTVSTYTPQPPPMATSWNDLLDARALLASGHVADARRTLVRAQALSVLRPVTPDQPNAVGDNATAIQIRDAIRMLDRGSQNGALQAIDLAMNSSREGTQAWPSYSPPPPSGYSYPATSNYYYSGLSR